MTTVADEQGQVGGIEAVTFGMLVLVVGVLLIANAWGVVDAKSAARTAAREAARTFATAPETSTARADADAVSAGSETLREMGWANPRDRIVRTQGSFDRCDVATYEAIVIVPALRLAWLSPAAASFTVRAYHSERVDPFRSGVPAGRGPNFQTACGGGDLAP